MNTHVFDGNSSSHNINLASRHSLRLPDWGPYTKKYIGISHIPDERAGFRFDLSVFPGFYRRKVEVPNVMWDSGFHPWEVASDLSYFSYRHELEWKDRVFCDISYSHIDSNSRLIRCECINNTNLPQTLALHYMASMNFPSPTIYSAETLRPYRANLPKKAIWIGAMDYHDLSYAKSRPTDNLMPDGLLRGEQCGHGFTGPSGLGIGFGKDKGDTVTYNITVKDTMPSAILIVRYRMEDGDETIFNVSGIIKTKLVLNGDNSFQIVTQSIGRLQAGKYQLALTSQGCASICLDGFAIVPCGQEEQVTFEPVIFQPKPCRMEGPIVNAMILKYPDVDRYYGMAWEDDNFIIREFHDSDLDCQMRYKVHEHVQTYFPGDEKSHYTNVFMRPIVVTPHSHKVINGLVCQGTKRQVQTYLKNTPVHITQADDTYRRAKRMAVNFCDTDKDKKYAFSQQLMAAATLSGLSYPIYSQRSYIKHYSPGRWWDCMYTWDSGFLGLGLLEHDTQRAVDCLKAYVTDVGNPHAAFIHHGSMLPTQMFLFLELWNRTQSSKLLDYFYPRLKQYYLFMRGRFGSSTIANLSSGLLRPWDYFYNSGGWDDYPPQAYVHANHLTATVTPVMTSTYVARFAKILRMAATAIGLDKDISDYDTDINVLSGALQEYSWDEHSGYFGYVTHDGSGKPTGILRHTSGTNFNMGLDGASPIFAGLCAPNQEQRILEHLKTEGQLWSRIGISAVDQSAPYYRRDGYWNGTVWMAHQWVVWKSMLDLGQTDFAFKIAQSGLDVWKKETDDTYHCFEHFIIETGRGAGWHQFTSLSSPVMSWFSAYYRPGHFTCGLDVWVQKQRFSSKNSHFKAALNLYSRLGYHPCVLVCMDPHYHYNCTWNGKPTVVKELMPGCLSVALSGDVALGTLIVERSEP